MPATRNRVVITGIGVLTPVGNTLDAYWSALLSGKSGAGRITRFDTTGHSVTFAAEVKDFDPGQYMDPKEAKRMDLFSQYAVAAAKGAVQDSGLDFAREDRYRCGAIIASGIGGLTEMQEQNRKYIEKGPGRISPFFVPKMMLNAAAGQIAIAHGLGGPNWGVASACASANHAMGTALRTIQHGDADVMLTGGSEAAMTYLAIAGFSNMGALSTRNDAPELASRPFDKNRDGFVLGEGAAILTFESLEHAQARGAKIYAEVLGIGNSDDAYHITAPDPDGTGGAYAMNAALKDAGLKPDQISYINAHGTSTPMNDKIETAAIKRTFGDAAKKIPISSTKSMIGHLLGAAAAVELVAAVMSIKDGVVHPTANYETPDPECDLDYVPGSKRAMNVQYAMSNSLGFGGHNSAIIVGKFSK
ncbi:MAG TPA: beta-ketoacyl-ACP synthase II [Planctomycetota bacterium]|nr:beta-ketoacyl-ACP synthase II [Planctomycetota bacterium]